jgi:TRAP-type C4-dicarboxylate transport system permease large subunit
MDNVRKPFLFSSIFFPIASQLGFVPIHFSLGHLISWLWVYHPPVGTTSFLSCQLEEVKIEEAAKDLVRTYIALQLSCFW